MGIKELNKRYFAIFVVFLFGALIIELTGPRIFGFQTYRIEPLNQAGDFFSSPVTLFSGASVPWWGLILTFAMIFSVVFVLVKSIHLFKNEANRGPAIIFSLAIALLTIFATDITELIIYLASILTFFIVIAAVLLVGWASYLGLHTSVSGGLSDIASVASERYQAKNVAKQSKTGYLETLNAYENTKIQRKALGGLRKGVYNKDKNLIQQQLMVFDSLQSKLYLFNKSIERIYGRIKRENLDTDKKTKIEPLLDNIETLRDEFTAKVNEVRNNIEKIKSSIKNNDFASAENYINRAIESEQKLENVTVNLAKKESEINEILLS